MNSETPLLLRRFPGTREGTASPQGHRRAASHLPPPTHTSPHLGLLPRERPSLPEKHLDKAAAVETTT